MPTRFAAVIDSDVCVMSMLISRLNAKRIWAFFADCEVEQSPHIQSAHFQDGKYGIVIVFSGPTGWALELSFC